MQNPEEVKDQIIDLIGCNREDIIPASAKTGIGIQNILEAIVDRVSPPEGDEKAFASFDFRLCFQPVSWY